MPPVDPNRSPIGRHFTASDRLSGACETGIVSDPKARLGRRRVLDLMERFRAEIGRRLRASPVERRAVARDAHILRAVSGTLRFLDLSQACDGLGRACREELDPAVAPDRAGQAARTARATIDRFRMDGETFGEPA